jgi:hypothetical protein
MCGQNTKTEKYYHYTIEGKMVFLCTNCINKEILSHDRPFADGECADPNGVKTN